MLELVAAIEKEGSLSPAVRQALLSVDRGLFVSSYYVHEGMHWVRHTEARPVVYHNRPLVTRLDASGIPSSSSSQPSIMAAMLEALDVQPGQRVLEIGTGTGYNAALLRHLVGDAGQVVSVDIDKALVQQAQVHLQAAGFPDVCLVTANGLSGYAPRAPYERIIATGGFRSLPPAWQEQLVPGGVFVGNLLGPLVSVLIRLVKAPDQTLSGSMLTQDAFFMELRQTPATVATPFDWSPYDVLSAQEASPDVNLASALLDRSFLWYLQGARPTLRLQMRHDGSSLSRWLLDTEQHASVKVPLVPSASRSVQTRGELLPCVLTVYQRWLQLGAPSLTDYRFAMVKQNLCATRAAECWPVGEHE